MKQSQLMSFVESTINILVGFGIAVGAQALFLPMLGVAIPISANLSFAAIMTVISIARSYGLRRLFEALHIRRPLSPFMQAVIAERYRQIEQEGWSLEHDDDHAPRELALAGAGYVRQAGRSVLVPMDWPWSKDWWKPTGFRRDLVKGSALIVAEGEKFDRARKSKRQPLMTDDRRDNRGVNLIPKLDLAHGKTPSERGGSSV